MKEDRAYEDLSFIAEKYDEIKGGIDKESRKSWSKPIDEDVFHDTILKCVEKIRFNDLTPQQVLNYVFISYKTNYIREQQYARNAMSVDVKITDDMRGYDIPDTPDYEIIKEAVIKEFGEKEWSLFEDYIRGTKVSELERSDGEKGLYYRFNKIRAYIKRNFLSDL